eukprot:4482651-Amphidinium_carterae.2
MQTICEPRGRGKLWLTMCTILLYRQRVQAINHCTLQATTMLMLHNATLAQVRTMQKKRVH